MSEEVNSAREAMLYNQRIAHLSKALWKAVEKDWQSWIKPFDLNINEHHVLSIASRLQGASISDIAKFGVMHVSTAFNFSKNLEERGLLSFSKRDDDKRNTYVEITKKGEDLLKEIDQNFVKNKHAVLEASQPLKDMYGQFPQFLDLLAVIRNVYGNDFMEIFEKTFNIEE